MDFDSINWYMRLSKKYCVILIFNSLLYAGLNAQLVNNVPIDTLIIKKISINNVPIDHLNDSLKVNYKDKNALIIDKKLNDLTFDWGFEVQKQIDTTYLFAIKLEGFDKNWIIVKNKTSIQYAKLRPGFYTFKIRYAVNGYWNTNLTERSLIVKPKFYQTWWAKLSFVGVVIAAIVFIR
jgi:hypothetical protein